MAEGNGQPLEQWFVDLLDRIGRWHDMMLAASGGTPGEHTGQLEACIGRAFQSAFGEPIYPTDAEKAAALFHGIITSHPFVDGNKRTATATAILFLILRDAVPDEFDLTPILLRLLGEVAVVTASDGMTVDEVCHWIRRILGPLKGEA
jgi:death on curing protein